MINHKILVKELPILSKIEDLTQNLPFYSLLPDQKLMTADWQYGSYSFLALTALLLGRWVKRIFKIGHIETIEEIFQPYIDGEYDRVHLLNKEWGVTHDIASQYKELKIALHQFPHIFCTVSSSSEYKKTEYLDIVFGYSFFSMNLLRVRITKRQ